MAEHEYLSAFNNARETKYVLVSTCLIFNRLSRFVYLHICAKHYACSYNRKVSYKGNPLIFYYGIKLL